MQAVGGIPFEMMSTFTSSAAMCVAEKRISPLLLVDKEFDSTMALFDSLLWILLDPFPLDLPEETSICLLVVARGVDIIGHSLVPISPPK